MSLDKIVSTDRQTDRQTESTLKPVYTWPSTLLLGLLKTDDRETNFCFKTIHGKFY